jgi:hypothetical protein
MLMVLVQSMIRRLPNFVCPKGRIHHRTYGCKWSLLEVSRGKYKGEHGGAQVESEGQESRLLFFRCFLNL